MYPDKLQGDIDSLNQSIYGTASVGHSFRDGPVNALTGDPIRPVETIGTPRRIEWPLEGRITLVDDISNSEKPIKEYDLRIENIFIEVGSRYDIQDLLLKLSEEEIPVSIDGKLVDAMNGNKTMNPHRIQTENYEIPLTYIKTDEGTLIQRDYFDTKGL